MIRAIGSLLLVAVLAGCVANSSSPGNDDGDNPPPAQGVTVTPAEATVAAGATRQFTATADDGSDITWLVNGVGGGNSTLGTISSTGLYTAPALPPAGGTVTIKAVSEADASLTGSATVTLIWSNASLDGAYVFAWRGTVPGGPFGAIGRFIADGNGGIDAGREDVNLPDGVVLDAPFNGSYEVAADGTGQAVLVTSRGSIELRFVIGADGRARVIRVDNGASAAGTIVPQAAPIAALSDDYVFRIGGTTGAGVRVATAGRFTADADGDIGAGIEDRNHGGAVAHAVEFTGAYELDDDGHGSLALSSALGVSHYTFYAVSGDELLLLRSDPANPLTGSALIQADADFADSDLADDYVFYLLGDDGVNLVATAGLFNADGNGSIGDGIYDRNGGGTVQQANAFTGVYTIDDDGRGIATFFAAGGRTELAFYMQSPDHALVIETDAAAVRSGEFVAQPGDDFSTATLDGSFVFANVGVDNPLVGRLALNGDGDIKDGVEVMNAASGTPQAIALDGSYTMEAAGRGELVLLTEGGGRQDYIIYVIDPTRALLLGAGPGALPLAWLRQQWPAAQ
ncbi:MAG TPA: hypothetical protein VFH57_04570 [Gammaproteobacteria bacterium]|nr:hypothetical protein [Gammaproteobacteria bacterium]